MGTTETGGVHKSARMLTLLCRTCSVWKNETVHYIACNDQLLVWLMSNAAEERKLVESPRKVEGEPLDHICITFGLLCTHIARDTIVITRVTIARNVGNPPKPMMAFHNGDCFVSNLMQCLITCICFLMQQRHRNQRFKAY